MNTEDKRQLTLNFTEDSVNNDPAYTLPRELEKRISFKSITEIIKAGKTIQISKIKADGIDVGFEQKTYPTKNPHAIATKNPTSVFYLHLPEIALDQNYCFAGREVEDTDNGFSISFDNLKNCIDFYLQHQDKIQFFQKESDFIDKQRKLGESLSKENGGKAILFPEKEGYIIYPLYQTGLISGDGVTTDYIGTHIDNLSESIKKRLEDQYGGYIIYNHDLNKTYNEEISKEFPQVTLSNSVLFPEMYENNQKRPSSLIEFSKDKIEDFGDVISGAKKDKYFSLNRILQNYSDDELLNSPTSSTLSPVNYSEFVKDGIASIREAAILKYFREKIGRKPDAISYTFQKKKWLKAVNQYKETLDFLINRDKQSDNSLIESKIKELDTYGQSELSNFIGAIINLGFPEKNINLGKYEIRKFSDSEFSIVTGNLIIDTKNSFEEACVRLGEILDSKKKKSLKFNIFQNRETNQYSIGKRLPLQDIILVSPFDSWVKANKYLKENQSELEKLYREQKLYPQARPDKNRPRKAFDHRQGRNVTPKDFEDAFQFRGVQFGNWVNNAERQIALNEAYDALMDLSTILTLPSQALSLGGELGLAFGARGSGDASAHYEPGQVVINLTKTKGAGSLAHEWWHAIDNYFSRKNGYRHGFMSERSQFENRNGEVREEMKKAFENITKTIEETELVTRSRKLDISRSKPYWSTTLELSARAFESYIMYKMNAQNYHNDYLVNYKKLEAWIETSISTPKNYPYPTIQESEKINQAFKQFSDTIQYKKDEKTNKTVLFKQIAKTETMNVNTETQRIKDDAIKNGTYLKAPNGEPSNLTPEQWVQVRTTAFKEWFGDWENDPQNASKVIDTNGEPLVVYHGTDSDFFTFNHDRQARNGFYFTQSQETASGFNGGKHIVAAFLDIKNPKQRNYAPIVSKQMFKDGCDGVIAKITTTEKLDPAYVVSSPNQIKSAIMNNGEFRLSNPDIRFQIIGEKGAANVNQIRENLNVAKEMEKKAVPPREIYLATGWERTKDNAKWKYDLPTENIRFKDAKTDYSHKGEKFFTDKLDKIIDYPELFKCYPTLKDIEVTFGHVEKAISSYYDNKIFIESHGKHNLDQLEALTHAIQHAIQQTEGFALGGAPILLKNQELDAILQKNGFENHKVLNEKINNLQNELDTLSQKYPYGTQLKYFSQGDQDTYKNLNQNIQSYRDTLSVAEAISTGHKITRDLAGEVEARNAVSRLNMPDDQRIKRMITETEDVSEESKIYLYKNIPEINEEIDRMSDQLHTKTFKYFDRDEIPQYVQEQMKESNRYPAFYDISKDQVCVIMNEISNISEVQAALLHEVLVHKGLRAMIPDEKMLNSFLEDIWKVIPEKEQKEYLGIYKNKQVASEEYIANFAEGYQNPSVWEKIKAVFKNFFRKLGIDLKITDNDLKYILHASKKCLKKINDIKEDKSASITPKTGMCI